MPILTGTLPTVNQRFTACMPSSMAWGFGGGRGAAGMRGMDGGMAEIGGGVPGACADGVITAGGGSRSVTTCAMPGSAR